MKISFSKENNILNVTVDGRLDTSTAPEFEAFLKENCNGIDGMIVNCEKLAYVSSAGLRVLLTAHKNLKDSLKLINVGELVMEVFEMTGFATILNIQ